MDDSESTPFTNSDTDVPPQQISNRSRIIPIIIAFMIAIIVSLLLVWRGSYQFRINDYSHNSSGDIDKNPTIAMEWNLTDPFIAMEWNLTDVKNPQLRISANQSDESIDSFAKRLDSYPRNCLTKYDELSITMMGDSQSTQRAYIITAADSPLLCHSSFNWQSIDFKDILYTELGEVDCGGCDPVKWTCRDPNRNVVWTNLRQEFIMDAEFTRIIYFQENREIMNNADIQTKLDTQNREIASTTQEFYTKVYFPIYGWPEFLLWSDASMHNTRLSYVGFRRSVVWYLSLLNETVPYQSTTVVWIPVQAMNGPFVYNGANNDARNVQLHNFHLITLDLIQRHNANPYNPVKIVIFPLNLFDVTSVLKPEHYRDGAHLLTPYLAQIVDYIAKFICFLRQSQ